MVGREGVVGMSAAVGMNNSQLRAVMQGEGSALRILNSKGLQAASCECYEVVKAMY